MALSDQDRETITLIAGTVAKEIIVEVMKTHIDGCPHGQKLNAKIAWFTGVCTVLGFLAGKFLK